MSKEIKYFLYYARSAPTDKSAMDGSPFTIKIRYLPPWKAISDYEYNCTNDLSVVKPIDLFSGWKKAANFVKLLLRDKGCFHFLILIGRVKCLVAKHPFSIKFLKKQCRQTLDYSSVAPTITRWVFHIGSGRFAHPREIRGLTMREAARIQSFSDDFHFAGSRNEQAGQIGNAVPPYFMEKMAQKIIDSLQYKVTKPQQCTLL